jgi:hypothetical protein
MHFSPHTLHYLKVQQWHMMGPGKEAVKFIFIQFPFSLLSAALKCVLSNSTTGIRKNELGPKI